MTTITVSLTDEVAHALSQRASQNQMSEARVVEAALQRYLPELNLAHEPSDPLVGLFDLGRDDAAEQFEALIHAAMVESSR